MWRWQISCLALCFLIAGLAGLLSPSLEAQAIQVPGDYPTIQLAIDNAPTDGVIEVFPGTYIENLIVPPKNLVIRSTDGPQVTVIDGGRSGRRQTSSVVSLLLAEFDNTTLEGFTLTNGSGRLVNGERLGGGLYISDGAPRILRCIICKNSADIGGGVYVSNSDFSVVVANTAIVSNEAVTGGAVFVGGPGRTMLTFDVIVENTATTIGGGVMESSSAILSLHNSVVRGNKSPTDPQLSGQPYVTYSNIEGGGNGLAIIDADPLFVNALELDFHLASESPNIDAGSQNAQSVPETDVDGEPRVTCEIPDIGLDETPVGPNGCTILTFVRTDVDGDGLTNFLADTLFLLSYLFVPQSPEPECLDAADGDDNGALSLIDALAMLNWGFLPTSTTPPDPWRLCGFDPSEDGLRCEVYACP